MRLLPWWECWHVRPLMAAVLPLARAREAHELVEAGEATGKIVLVP